MGLKEDILSFLEQICQDENLKQTTFESGKAGVFVGVITAAGAVLLGPPGIALGAVVSGAIGTYTCKDFKPMHQVIREMSEDRRGRLFERVQGVMTRENLATVGALAGAAAAGSVRQELIGIITEAVKSQ